MRNIPETLRQHYTCLKHQCTSESWPPTTHVWNNDATRNLDLRQLMWEMTQSNSAGAIFSLGMFIWGLSVSGGWISWRTAAIGSRLRTLVFLEMLLAPFADGVKVRFLHIINTNSPLATLSLNLTSSHDMQTPEASPSGDRQEITRCLLLLHLVRLHRPFRQSLLAKRLDFTLFQLFIVALWDTHIFRLTWQNENNGMTSANPVSHKTAGVCKDLQFVQQFVFNVLRSTF